MAYANLNTELRLGWLTTRIQGFRAMLADRKQRRAVYATTVRELQSCSDRELADLGIHRSEIAQIAEEAALRA